MELAYQRKIEECLKHGGLNDWETSTFGDILQRNQPTLSFKQKAMVDKIYTKLIEGKDTKDIPPATSFGECKVQATEAGHYVFVADHPVGKAVTKRDGMLIAEWLASAINDIRGTTPPTSNGQAPEGPVAPATKPQLPWSK